MLAPLAAGTLLLTTDRRNTALFAAMPAFAIGVLIAFVLRPGARPAMLARRAGGLGVAEYAQGLLTVLLDWVLLSICMMSALRSMT